MRNKRRLIAFALSLALAIPALGVTVFAEANPPADDVIIYTSDPTEPPATEAPKPAKPKETQPPETEPPATTEATKPTISKPFEQGNAVASNLQYHADTNKQFITIETRSGEVFYIIIDYDAPVSEDLEQFSTYFLNKVDDADLKAILEDGEVVEVCGCIDKCYAGHVNVTCPICAKNMTECVGLEPEPTEEPTIPVTEPQEEQKKESGASGVLVFLLILGLGGGAGWYFFRDKLTDKKTDGDTDLDEYDYGMEDDEDYADFEEYKEDET